MDNLLHHHPVFEANQVLTSGHLNDVFDYLDQQERRTRSHLIGIGIVCGLELQRTGSKLLISKGCGVTSQGYLIVEPEDVELTAYRSYTLPSDLEYAPLKKSNTQLALWELFEGGVPNTSPLGTPDKFLDDKAVLLFLELKKEALRNCSPNNCDDKGSQVTATVRRLLIGKGDLDSMIAAANQLGTGLSSSDLDAALSKRLSLPDLCARRFDVVNTHPVTSADVYGALLDMLRTGKRAKATREALSAAYAAFAPLLVAKYASDPFTGFATSYGFLDDAPTSTAQVKFLQYYADLFADLIQAYDEFRWRGLDLLCACCPDDRAFPRHLVLGLLSADGSTQYGSYRQRFIPSPATGDCANESEEVQQLFARLVEMAVRFSATPTLPAPSPAAATSDAQIRITPSAWRRGGTQLGDQAIPYYYAQSGTPPLYQLWSATKTRRRRAHHNLSYNADLYTPPAPSFVTDPLRFDLESHDFLRVEGHLGKDYQAILRTLLTLKSRYRLPVDFIAVRTGSYDDKQPLELAKEAAKFQDLEALYTALSTELRSTLAEGVRQLYDVKVTVPAGITLAAGTPKLPLLRTEAPSYRHSENTLGSWYERFLSSLEAVPYIDVDPNAVDGGVVLLVYCVLFRGTVRLDDAMSPRVVAIYYMSRLAETLPAKLSELDFASFANRYEDLLALLRFFRSSAIESVPQDLQSFLPNEELIDFCESVLFSCALHAIEAVRDEYVSRIRELKKRGFLSRFLEEHPGVDHKGGVPVGGTFILVYHGDDAAARGESLLDFGDSQSLLRARTPAEKRRVQEAFEKVKGNRALSEDDNLRVLIDAIELKDIVKPTNPKRGDPADAIIAQTVQSLTPGVVIADLFLPYRIAGGGASVEYVLPKVTPVFTTTIRCTTEDGAPVTIQARGGVPPYDVSVDGGAFQALGDPLRLAPGQHILALRDSEDTAAAPQTITVPAQLTIGAASFECTKGKYVAKASISGGTAPYQVNGTPLEGTTLASPATDSGQAVTVEVADGRGCTVEATFEHTCPAPCTLPCDGLAENRGYRFFLPDANAKDPFQEVSVKVSTFQVQTVAGGAYEDLTAQIPPLPSLDPAQLSDPNVFPRVIEKWIAELNRLIASTPMLNQAGKAQWLALAYERSQPGRLGTLSIEHFVCLDFLIEVDVSYRLRSQREDRTSGRFIYTPKQTLFKGDDQQIVIPAFDGTTLDQCSEKPVRQPFCAVPPNFQVKIDVAGVNQGPFELRALTSSNVEGVEFLWEAQEGMPALANGQTVTVRFRGLGEKVVNVTAFTKEGCTVSAQPELIKVSPEQ